MRSLRLPKENVVWRFDFYFYLSGDVEINSEPTLEAYKRGREAAAFPRLGDNVYALFKLYLFKLKWSSCVHYKSMSASKS